MSSAVETSSTNDVTSSANTSFHSSVTSATTTNKALRQSTVLTTDGIIRECIKQGFYRNPICNEKLYLHNKGYDQIAPTAFEPYTDVKVLWLEGNALSTIACGAPYIQVRPPKRYDPFATNETSGSEDVNNEKEKEENKEVKKEKKKTHVDPTESLPPTLPEPHEVPEKERDVFSSLYGTVRQLYLHNNLFRTMPDLSRFERLDAVNLANNFISRVEPHCAAWDAALAKYAAEQAREAELALQHSKSALRERQATSPARALSLASPTSENKAVTNMKEEKKEEEEGKENTTTPATTAVEEVRVVSVAEARALRAAQRAKYLRQVEAYSRFCSHCALSIDEKPPASHKHIPHIPYDQRNPCSSLRTLNLASNRLASFEDVVGLLCYKALSVLDLSHNAIEEGEMILLILERLPQLRSLKLSGNPLVRSLPRYRKTILARCKGLIYLDDRPVFVEERRLVNAWAVGGEDGEAKERTRIKEENDAAEQKRLDDFRTLLRRHTHRQQGGTGGAAGLSGDTVSNDGIHDVLGSEVRAGGPHAEYISAIAGEAIVRRSRPTRDNAARHHAEELHRRDAAELDSSPTSTDDEEDDEETHSNSSDNEVQEEVEPVAIVEEEANKETITVVRQPVQRVLSSNGVRPVGGEGAAAQEGQEMNEVQEQAAANEEERDNDDAMDDVYIPQA